MKKKFLLNKKWFLEDFKPGEPKLSTWMVAVEKDIYSGQTPYQKIDIFETKEFGRILALDGLVQLSTKHEFVYHEMLVQPALFSHKKPEKVLIVGGGDGGALREVLKHPVKEVVLVDIDEKVINLARRYLPSVSRGAFSDKRVRVVIEDGLEFISGCRDRFDIIIVDLTDYFGPAEAFSRISFYRKALRALRKEGIFAAQTAFFQENFAKAARKNMEKVFPYFRVHRAFVGCFPFGEHTFSFGSKKIDFEKVTLSVLKKKQKRLKIESKYYSPEIHLASTVLPPYLSK